MTTAADQSADVPVNPGPVERVAMVSLGCPKNLVDSEKMFGMLAEDGLIPVADEDEADAIVINTCGFLEASKQESVEQIEQAVARKQAGTCKRVIVAGCLVQRHRAKLLEWVPGVDALIGVFDRDRVVEAVRGPVERAEEKSVSLPVYSSIAANSTVAKQRRAIDAAGYFESDRTRLRLTVRHLAYLRMSEGCNQNCTFCTIPSIRGKMRSKHLDAILAEQRELMADGAFELNLIGQDTTSYGDDIGYASGLAGLLREMDREASRAGGAWLRLMYAYPSCFTDEMIDAIAKLPNVVKYIDMPLQHINDHVLDRMRRHTSRELIEALLHKLRDRVPGITLRTTLISGFPGETDEEHAELLEFVREFGFDHLGVFGYSPEPGTPAGSLHASGEAVPDDVIEARVDELMSAQQEVVIARYTEMVEQGEMLEVLIDGEADQKLVDESGEEVDAYEGRHRGQAPQIDGVTFVVSEEALSPGEVVRGRVVACDGYDLIAEAVGEPTREGRPLPVIG